MKTVFTIFQCKRVVLPHIFLEHCYPVMKEILGGEVKAFLIQHRTQVTSPTQTASIDKSRIDLVTEWTLNDKYRNAEIVGHESTSPIPYDSYRIGLDLALREQADFHVWLEDDALIFDTACDMWPEKLKHHDVGTYRIHSKHVLVCYCVSRRSFDLEMKSMMDQYEWTYAAKQGVPLLGHIEWFSTQSSKTGQADLGRDFADRIHPSHNSPILIDIIRKVAPEKLELLYIDFPALKLQEHEQNAIQL